MNRTPVRPVTVAPCHVYWWSVASHSYTRPYSESGMTRPWAAATLRLGSCACMLRACTRPGRNIRAPLRWSCGLTVASNEATGPIAGAVAALRFNVAVLKLRATCVFTAESTDDRFADSATGSLKSTGVTVSLHAAAAKASRIPARRSNRILPPDK